MVRLGRLEATHTEVKDMHVDVLAEKLCGRCASQPAAANHQLPAYQAFVTCGTEAACFGHMSALCPAHFCACRCPHRAAGGQ